MTRNPFSSSLFEAQPAGSGRRPEGGRSYVAGSTTSPLRYMTIPQLLDRACERHGAAMAARFDASDTTLTWYDLRARADEVAAGLLALGVRRGDRVGIWAPNRLEWLLVQFGTARIGAVLVNINPAYRQGELDYALNAVGCKVLVMARALKSSDYLAMMRALAPEIDRPYAGREVLGAVRLPALEQVIVLGDGPLPARAIPFSRFTRLAGPAHRVRLGALAAALEPDDPINIQFTSGTTGSPKGATLSHLNIVNNARFCAQAMRLTEEDRLCLPVPLYHCFGMVLGVLAAATRGCGLVFPGEAFDAGQTLASITRHRCTALHGVPTMFSAVLEHETFAQADLRALRTGIMAGAPCPIETMNRVMREMHMDEITIAYGMTETSPVSFQSDLDDAVDLRVSTVGRIQPHCEAKIIGADGRIVPVGEKGELCTRGYLVMRGYWNDPERTDEATDAAGWMHTGDLASLDENGYCRIVGRVKDMLIRGGENVYPAEIEEHLHRHPDVAQAQVFGIPHERLGEEVCAWVVLRAGADTTPQALQAFCREQIAHFKVPREIRIVEAFPMTATGKPRKVEMRERMMAELGLADTGGAR
ncbi:MAG: AMP-binding protein [Burkholderiaceae bacterium]